MAYVSMNLLTNILSQAAYIYSTIYLIEMYVSLTRTKWLQLHPSLSLRPGCVPSPLYV